MGDKMIKMTIEVYYPFRPTDYQEYIGPYTTPRQLASTIEQAARHDMVSFIDDQDNLEQFLDAAFEHDFDGETNIKMEVVEFDLKEDADETHSEELQEKVVYKVEDTITLGGSTVHYE